MDEKRKACVAITARPSYARVRIVLEKNAVTKLSNLYFIANQQAAKRVIKMGKPQETVFLTGCPSVLS